MPAAAANTGLWIYDPKSNEEEGEDLTRSGIVRRRAAKGLRRCASTPFGVATEIDADWCAGGPPSLGWHIRDPTASMGKAAREEGGRGGAIAGADDGAPVREAGERDRPGPTGRAARRPRGTPARTEGPRNAGETVAGYRPGVGTPARREGGWAKTVADGGDAVCAGGSGQHWSLDL